MASRLEEFIRFVVTAPTLEDGKIRMANHMADMRTLLRTCDDSLRPRIIAKVAFLTMRGCNTGWSKIEVVNLMSHERTSYKRIGYLAAQLVLDENDEFMTMMTQVITNDLTGKPGAQILALTMIANVVSPEIAQTAAVKVAHLVEDMNPRIQKKALMAAVQIVRKCPDLADTFKGAVSRAISGHSHSVIIAGLRLCIEILKAHPEYSEPWAQLQHALVSQLKTIYSSPATKEYKFSSASYNDPFLMETLMEALGILGVQSDDLDDILSTIATGVDVRRNTGRSLLMEAVFAITRAAKKPSLQALAYNQIGRLFDFSQPNVIYTALSAFSSILYSKQLLDRSSADSIVLQRYKSAVVKCLDHPDPSIRRRALDVIAALIDETNVVELVPEVLGYLPLSEPDFRGELVAKVFTAVNRFSPSPEWTVRTTIDIFEDGGNYVGQDILISFARTISRDPRMAALAAQLLAGKAERLGDLQPLTQAAAYAVGEYANDLCAEHVDTFAAVIRMPQTKDETKLYLLTAIAKLAIRDPKAMPAAVQVMTTFAANNTLELQQRAGEYLRALQAPQLAAILLQPMEDIGGSEGQQPAPASGIPSQMPMAMPSAQSTDEVDLLLDMGPAPPKQPTPHDIASEILGLTPQQPPAQQQPAQPVQQPVQPQPVQQPVVQQQQPRIPQGGVEAFRNADLAGYFELRYNDNDPNQLAIRVTIVGLSQVALTNFTPQFGASQGWAIQAQKAPTNVLEAAGGRVYQTMILVAPRPGMPLSRLAMKVIVNYLYRSQPIKEVLDVNDVFRH